MTESNHESFAEFIKRELSNLEEGKSFRYRNTYTLPEEFLLYELELSSIKMEMDKYDNVDMSFDIDIRLWNVNKREGEVRLLIKAEKV